MSDKTQYAGTGLKVNVVGLDTLSEDAIREIVRDELRKSHDIALTALREISDSISGWEE